VRNRVSTAAITAAAFALSLSVIPSAFAASAAPTPKPTIAGASTVAANQGVKVATGQKATKSAVKHRKKSKKHASAALTAWQHRKAVATRTYRSDMATALRAFRDAKAAAAAKRAAAIAALGVKPAK